MPASKNVLHNIRQKSDTTKRIIAITLAALPAVFVGYAQFYMDGKHANEKVLAQKEVQSENKREAASALASLGKIFSEGKNTVSDTLVDLKKVDNKFLKNDNTADVSKVNPLNVAASSTDGNASTSGEVINVSQ